MNAKSMLMGAVLAVASLCRGANTPARLTYTGADAGEWTASGVWTDESGASVDWTDGALAVIDDKSVALPSDVEAEGIEYANVTAARYLTGVGKLTLGAGGLSVVKALNVDGVQVNIRNAGGVHLAADQVWTWPIAKIFCLDEMNPLTAEPGVTLTVGGQTQLRVNCKGSLGQDVTVILRESAQLSPAEGNPSLGTPTLVFEGPGVTSTFGGQWCGTSFNERYANRLCLRSGASLAFPTSKLCYFEVPELTVDGDAADSRFAGGLVRLASSETVFDVADGHTLVLGAILTNAPGATSTVVKRGAGTLTLAQSEGPVDFTVAEGTLKFIFPGYRHYRFKIDGTRGSEAIGAQIAEFKLLDGANEITGGTSSFAEGTKADWSADMDCAPEEKPTMAADGSLDTKWLDRRASVSRIATEGDKVWVQLTFKDPVVATGYSWATANDAAPSTGNGCNDPAAWRLLASDDGENWVELDKRENMGPYETRKAWVGEFPVVYPSGRGADAKLGHIVVEADGMLDLRGFTSSTTVSGVIENRGGTILTDEGTLTGNLVTVLGGTLSRGPSTFAGKFFRVTVTGNGGAEQTSIAEFSLYAADGSRVNKGTFTSKSVDSPAALAANQVALTTSGKVSNWENIDKVFDGDANTKLYVSGLTPSAKAPIAFTFRLPESAARVAGYSFTTAADTSVNNDHLRNPTAWTIEGSFDGETWYVLDERTDASTPHTNCTEYNGGVPYAVTAWGDPVEGEEYPFGEDGCVAVAPGAVLELRSEKLVISALSVDCDVGAGTITRFTPAPNGTLYLTTTDPKSVRRGFIVPLTIGEVANARNFASWSVVVNGEAKPNCRLRFANGCLQIDGLGFMLRIR